MTSTDIIRVVFIDYSHHNANKLARILGKTSNMSLEAHFTTVRDAINKVQSLSPDVVIIYEVFDMDKFELLHLLMTQLTQTAFIMCTVSNQDSFIKGAIKAGIKYVLPMPFYNTQYVTETIQAAYDEYVSGHQ